MRGIDAGYLYMETPTIHMHTLKVGVLDTSHAAGGYTFDRFVEELAARLHLLPPFRRRIVRVPLGLHHPMWIEDPAFDIRRHVFREVAPSPGSQEQLDDVVARIASKPLPRDRPLWSITMVEGLADGGVAAVAKLHHAVADGVASAALLANVATMSPADQAAPEAPPWHPETVPGTAQLVSAAIREWFADLRTLPALLKDTAGRVAALTRKRRAGHVDAARPLIDAPMAPFTGAPDAQRVFATVGLEFDDLKAIRAQTGVAFNDVVMAVIDGALVRWMRDQGQRLDRPLLAAVPVSADEDGGIRLSGNRLSSLLTSLATDVEDPMERLRRIAASAEQAKEVQRTLGPDMLERWVQFTPPGPFGAFMRLYSRLRLADRHPPAVNMVISNVPGPREPLYIAGAELVDFFSVGPVLEGMPLNITAWSYRGRMNFAILASPRTCRNIRALADALRDSLEELLAGSGARTPIPRPDAEAG
jgi:diacylglycerol O-acyltransferase